MIDQCEVGHANHGRNQNIENRLPHVQLLLNSARDVSLFTFGGPASTGALNAGEPIEEPKTDGTGDVKNHLSDLDLDLTIRSGCRGHLVSFSMVGNKNACEFTSAGSLTHTNPCVIKNSSSRT
jgi:hypothetical protein